MKKQFFSIIVGLLAVVAFGGCSRVEPGHVGIKVNLNGDNRGVSADQIVTGRVTYNPFTTVIYTFPTFTQRFAWTANEHEGSRNDESITFNTSEGASINVDVGFAAGFSGESVPSIFEEFRKPAGDIVDGWVRDQVRNCLNEAGSQQRAVDILGTGKMTFIKALNTCVFNDLDAKGFTNIEVSLIGEARPNGRVTKAIGAVIEARQAALKAEEEVKQAEAEADKVAAMADGEKRRRIAEAEGAAAEIKLKAEAQAEANRTISESLTAELIEYERVRTWDGALPRFTGGGVVPMLDVSTTPQS
jgi:regulator of protease activity HflC (stomatin/prohibitin superfamily)